MGRTIEPNKAGAEIAEILAKHQIPRKLVFEVFAAAEDILDSAPCMGQAEQMAVWDVKDRTELYGADGTLKYVYPSAGSTAEEARELAELMKEDQKGVRFIAMPSFEVIGKPDPVELADAIEKELRKRFPELQGEGSDVTGPPPGYKEIKEIYAVVANDNFPLSERHNLLGLFEDEKEAAEFRKAVEDEDPHYRTTIRKELLNDASVPTKKK